MTSTPNTPAARHLTDEQVGTLNTRHGWFKYGDAQSDVSREFAHDAIELYLQTKARESGANTPTDKAQMSADDLARKFHAIYESLAPQFGYETRTDTKAFNPGTPNGRLMVAVCGEILAEIGCRALIAERDARDACLQMIFAELQHVAPWSESNDMETVGEIMCGVGLLAQKRDALIEDNRAMQSRLSALANHCRQIYDIVPMLPIDESSMEGATDALHAFCLMIGVNGIDIDSARTPTPTAKENDQ